MCGFAGFIDPSGRSGMETLAAMRDCLSHRGPDDTGNEVLSHGNASIGFGFRRLSIQDLSPAGHQPMFSDDGNICIMLNGEIYNFKEIRNELMAEGQRFRSHSDTEVVIHAYQRYGIKCLDRFIGMFAMVIYDKIKEQVVLIRDRAGVKPLYYYQDGNLLLFGSELKPFHKHAGFKKSLNEHALRLYFQHGYIPAPHTIFNNAYKIKPGFYHIYNLKNQQLSEHLYWTVDDAYKKGVTQISYADALIQTESLMQSAFNYRMVADVPVGVFLSGGYDSTAVTALLQKDSQSRIKTFTIGFEEKSYDESGHAKAVAAHLGTEHHELICSVNEAKELIPMLPEIYDEPFADSSAIPTFLVSRMARKEVTVALSADAGDETFAGYTKYEKSLQYIKRLNALPALARKGAAAASSVYAGFSGSNLSIPDRSEKMKLLMKSRSSVEAYNIITQQMTQKEVNLLMKNKGSFPESAFGENYDERAGLLNNFLWCDYKTYLPDDILCKVDRATMAVSLEGREPLIDHRLIEWAAQLPDEYKLQNGNGKRILKDIVHKYVPASIMERPKMGFRIPVDVWLKKDLRLLVEEMLNDQFLKEQGIFNADLIASTKKYVMEKEGADPLILWKLLVFQLWYKRWMN